MSETIHNTVCVTGGSGFIALHVVKQLLESGKTVHTTVRSTSNAAKVAPLTALAAKFPGKLHLFEADLLGAPEKFDAAMAGCSGVLHTASPFFVAGVTGETAEELLVRPAVNGTKTVLSACARATTVKRVVVTSSYAAVLDPARPYGEYTEADWNTFSKAADGGGEAYRYSKVAAERAAWQFVEDNKPGFDLVVLNPPFVFGENVNEVTSAEDLNTSSAVVLKYLNGEIATVPDGGIALVDVEDIARAHVLALDTPAASGRILVSGGQVTYNEFAAILRENFPAYAVPTTESAAPNKPNVHNDKSVAVLGMTYRSPADTLRLQGEALIRMGLAKPKA